MTPPDAFGLTPLPGGFSGETFLADAGGDLSVVRVYGERSASRGPEAGSVDAAVLRLVRGLLPVPDVLELRRADASVGNPGVLVTSHLPGSRLDLLLPGLAGSDRRVVGTRLGVLLGRLAGMPMPRRGRFVDGDLRVQPFGAAADLPGFVASRLDGTALADWPAADHDALLAIADRAQALLDGVGRTCLVHGDLNSKNLLVDPGTLEVTGVLDWEFAHAGLPGTDLGNLLRFERDPALTAAVLASYRGAVPDAAAIPDDGLLELARAADLTALVDLAGRRQENPVASRAHDLLRAVARRGDLHAVPTEERTP